MLVSYLGRALGARFFLMGALRDVASFDASTHLIDSELNVQTGGATIRVHNAAELNFRLGQLASLTTMPPTQQVVVVERQRVAQQKVIAAQIEFKKGNFKIALGMFQDVRTADPTNIQARQMLIEIDLRSRKRNRELDQLAEFQRQQAEIAVKLQQQKAFIAAVQTAQNQAQQNLNTYTAMQQQALNRQKQIAEQNLLAQAAMAQKAADFQRRVALMQSAYAIRKNQEIAQQLAVVKAEFETARQKQVAASEKIRQAQMAQIKTQVAKIQPALQAARQKQAAQFNDAVKETERRNQIEYDRLVAQGNQFMTALKHAQAAAAFETAKRLKHTAEVEQLIAKALTEQARAAAAAKSAAEKKRFEAQLAAEEKRKQQLEAAQTTLRAKYQAAWNKAQAAMQARQFENAVVSYRLAAATMQTAEVTAALKQANTELAKSREAAALEAKKKVHDQQVQTAVNKKLAQGRAALAAKNYAQAIAAFKAAVALKPGDVELQTALVGAETARDQAHSLVKKDSLPRKDPGGSVPKKEPPDRTKLAYDAAMKSAQAAFAKKRYDEAIQRATEALRHKPGDPDATDLLAAAKKADAAADTAALDAKKKQQAYLTALREASAAYSAKKYEAAIAAAKDALAAKPGDPGATRILNNATNAIQAATTAASNAAKKKEEYDTAMKSGRAAMSTKDYGAAIKSFDEAPQD